ILAVAVVIYFWKMFKKDLQCSPEYNKDTYVHDIFGYFKKYTSEIDIFSQEWSDKLFIIKYIFSIIFWAILYKIIYLLIN
ncbi:MAG: hypothetical protein ACR2HS_05815, partial [Gammaproteobacteria bacterium]